MEKLDSRVCNSVVAALLHTLDHLPRSQTATPLSWNCKLLGRSCVFKQCSRGWPLAGGVEPHHGTHDTPARYYNQQTFVRNASTTSDFVRSKLLRGDRPTFVELKRTVVLVRSNAGTYANYTEKNRTYVSRVMDFHFRRVFASRVRLRSTFSPLYCRETWKLHTWIFAFFIYLVFWLGNILFI